MTVFCNDDIIIVRKNIIFRRKKIVAEENKMGVMPVNKLLITMSLPMVVSMLVQALYNIVDSIYVSRIGESALTAVSLVFPIQSFMIALGSGTGVGVNALLSQSLGAKQLDRANKAANVSIFLCLMNWIAMVIAGILLVGPYINSQSASAEITEYARQYLLIVTICSLGMFFQFTFERLLQSTGKTIYSMISQGVGAVINIALDPIFIFGYFGVPRMGVAGAAIATVIGQTIAAVVAGVLNFKKNPEIIINLKQMLPTVPILKRIYSVGVPAIIMQSIVSVMTFLLNRILIGFSSTAVAVLGVYFKVQSFIFMPVFGLNNGIIPIVAYNYGAAKRERITKTIRLGAIYATVIMLIGVALFQFIPDKLLGMFDASEDMLAIGIPALKTISISFIFAGFSIVMSATFQALSMGVYSMIVSIARQLVVLVPVAYVLSKIGGLDAIWYSFPIAEVVSLTLCSIFLKKSFKRIDAVCAVQQK